MGDKRKLLPVVIISSLVTACICISCSVIMLLLIRENAISIDIGQHIERKDKEEIDTNDKEIPESKEDNKTESNTEDIKKEESNNNLNKTDLIFDKYKYDISRNTNSTQNSITVTSPIVGSILRDNIIVRGYTTLEANFLEVRILNSNKESISNKVYEFEDLLSNEKNFEVSFDLSKVKNKLTGNYAYLEVIGVYPHSTGASYSDSFMIPLELN